MSGRIFAKNAVSVLRRTWLPIRRVLIPYGSRRDRAYCRFRYWLWRCSTFTRRRTSRRQYKRFQDTFEPSAADLAEQRASAAAWPAPPVFSVVTAVYRPPIGIFRETLRSLQEQTYPHWRWHVVDASPDDSTWSCLKQAAALDSRIQPVRLAENRGMAMNINVALHAATGDFLVMFDHDDTLAPFALHALASAVRADPEVDLLYSDCDKLDERGRRCDPFFKPGWSPELLLSANYIEHVVAFRRALLERVGECDPAFGSAFDWDFYLRLGQQARRCRHVPQVLYHWRKTPRSTAQTLHNKPGAQQDQDRAVVAHLVRLGFVEPRWELDARPPTSLVRGIPAESNRRRLRWTMRREARVSIVIPTRDHADLLRACLTGILEESTYADFEVVLVDTGSTEAATRALYETLADRRLRIVEFAEPFNFSRACNHGVQHADGDLILLLNNDIRVLHQDWLSRMAQWFEIPDVGIVGPKMLYPDGTVHHCGVVTGVGGLASLLFLGCDEPCDSVFGPDGWYRNVSGVSGACLLTRRTLYETLGGLDERLRLNYSDVDYCVRAAERGYRIVITPDARIVHYESVTHGRRIPRSDFLQATRSLEPLLRSGDPYFNPNLSCYSSYPTLRRDWLDNPMDANRDLLARLPDKEIIQLPDDLEPSPKPS